MFKWFFFVFDFWASLEKRNIQVILKLFASDDHKLNSCIIVYVQILIQVSPIRVSDR